jgi:hypothetical protein
LTALSCALATVSTGCANSASNLAGDLEARLETRLSSLTAGDTVARLKTGSAPDRSASLDPQSAYQMQQRRPETLPPQLSEPKRASRSSASESASPRSASPKSAVPKSASPQRSSAEQNAQQQRLWEQGAKAGYAASLSEQSAITDTEWNQVINDWKGAIATLAKITPNHPQYDDARTKIAIYQTGLQRAEHQYVAVVQSRYAAFDVSQGSGTRGTAEADGQQVRAWIEAGNFAPVEQLLTQSIKAHRFTRNGLDYADAVLVSAVSQKDVVLTAQLLDRLNQWVAQSPRSSMAYAVRSYFTQSYLWKDMALEIGQRLKECPPTEADLESLGASLSDAGMALSLDAKNPLALTSKLRLGKMGALAPNGKNGAAVEAVFQALIAVEPHSFQAHLEKASYLWSQDKSGQVALNFLRQAAAKAPANSALPMLVPMMHINIANDRADYRHYLNQPQIWKEIQTGSERVIAQLPEAVPYSALFADLASTTGRGALARRYQQIATNRAVNYPGDRHWPKMMASKSSG